MSFNYTFVYYFLHKAGYFAKFKFDIHTFESNWPNIKRALNQKCLDARRHLSEEELIEAGLKKEIPYDTNEYSGREPDEGIKIYIKFM